MVVSVGCYDRGNLYSAGRSFVLYGRLRSKDYVTVLTSNVNNLRCNRVTTTAITRDVCGVLTRRGSISVERLLTGTFRRTSVTITSGYGTLYYGVKTTIAILCVGSSATGCT